MHFCPTDKKAKAFGPALTISVSVSHLLISINASSNFAIYCAKVSNPSKKILMENFLPSPLLLGGGRYSIFDGLLSLFYKLCFRWSVPVSNFQSQISKSKRSTKGSGEGGGSPRPQWFPYLPLHIVHIFSLQEIFRTRSSGSVSFECSHVEFALAGKATAEGDLFFEKKNSANHTFTNNSNHTSENITRHISFTLQTKSKTNSRQLVIVKRQHQ